MEIHLGTAGWSYSDWKGGFYPPKLPPNQYLNYFANYFSFTEINSTFYAVPAEQTVKSWLTEVPDSFRFAIKIWQKITHEIGAIDLSDRINIFFRHISPLLPKISLFLLQFPPRFKYSEKHYSQLKILIGSLPNSYRYVLELRENSWFTPEIFSKLHSYPNFIIATSYLEGVEPVYPPDQSVYYFRLIGDRALEKFNQTQRDQKEIFDTVIKKIREFKQRPTLTDIFVIFNNHFRGFAPRDIIDFAKRFGLPSKQFTPQRSLDAFIGK
jgi:uncharacterized protein YecE (DUF72 family)